MDSRTARYVISAAILLVFSVFNFVTYSNSTTLQSTLALQPGLAQDFNTNRASGDYITGQFHETNGMLVSFYILNSAQFAAHQVGGAFNYLYSIKDVSSGSFTYTISTQDTYYLWLDHGTGLANTAETVYVQRTYVTHDLFRLQLGLIFIAVAGVELVFALRTRTPRTPPPPLPVPDIPPPSPGQSVT